MKSAIKTISLLAAGAFMAIGAMELKVTGAMSQVPGAVAVPPQCQGSRMQIPTSHGLEWKQIVVCPQD